MEEHGDEHGVNACLRALGVSKGTWHYRMRGGSKAAEKAARDEEAKGPIVEIIERHPAYGYRRIKPEYEEETGEVINHKRLRRLLRQWELSLRRTVARPKRSALREILADAKGPLNLVAGLDPGPLEVLTTDFTEVRFGGGSRTAHLIALVDVTSAWAAGWAVGPSANRTLALRAWKRARSGYSRLGVDLAGTIVHHDQDPVFTSYAWLQALLLDAGARLSYSENGARDNPWIESFWARFKGENHSLLLEAQTLEELRDTTERQIRYHNGERRHSRLGYKPPLAYLESEGITP